MDVWCEICGHWWDALDPGVRFVYGDGRWECVNEVECFDRRAAGRAVTELADAEGP